MKLQHIRQVNTNVCKDSSLSYEDLGTLLSGLNVGSNGLTTEILESVVANINKHELGRVEGFMIVWHSCPQCQCNIFPCVSDVAEAAFHTEGVGCFRNGCLTGTVATNVKQAR